MIYPGSDTIYLGEAKRGGQFSSVLIVHGLGWVLEMGAMEQSLPVVSVITIQVESSSLVETLGLLVGADIFFKNLICRWAFLSHQLVPK